MPRLRRELVIARPVETVFDALADARNAPSYDGRMVRIDPLSDDGPGLGARWSALVRTGRWPTHVVVECTAFERPRVLESTVTTPDGEFVRRLTFEPVPDGTLISWDWQVRTTGTPWRSVLRMARHERRIQTALATWLESSPEAARTR